MQEVFISYNQKKIFITLLFLDIAGLLITYLLNSLNVNIVFYVLIFGASFLLYNSRFHSLMDFTFVVFLFFNAYTLIPILSYYLSGKATLLDPYYTDQYFADYIYKSIIVNIMFQLTSIISNNSKNLNRYYLSKWIAEAFLVIGVVILYIQIYYSGAYSLMVIDANKGLILSSLYSMPEIYDYFVYIGVYYYFKKLFSLKQKNYWSYLIVAIVLFGYLFFWFKIGARGPILSILLISILGAYRSNNFRLNFTLILTGLLLFIAMITTSLMARWDIELKPKQLLEIVIENPETLNLGGLEYSWALKNYNELKYHNFQEKYFLESYITNAGRPIYNFMGINLTTPSKRFRDLYHSDRKVEGGEYGATGFSLIYEAKMAFGELLFWIPLLVYFLVINKIDRISKQRNMMFEIYLILLLPQHQLIARSPTPVVFFITKLIYAFILYQLLKPFIVNANSRFFRVGKG